MQYFHTIFPSSHQLSKAIYFLKETKYEIYKTFHVKLIAEI